MLSYIIGSSLIVNYSKCEHSIKLILKCALKCEKLECHFSSQSLLLLMNTIICMVYSIFTENILSIIPLCLIIKYLLILSTHWERRTLLHEVMNGYLPRYIHKCIHSCGWLKAIVRVCT